MKTRYLCIHGHFYQPPRENAWLEAIELQDSASPYHDWNERITEECYASNAASRVLDDAGLIVDIVNNYSKMSFNVGPTLMSWLEDERPEVHAAIVEADVLSRARFGGHGSAMAQVYNHIIMPLANARDKRAQVRWGAADFTRRFGRAPEGMWLAETAVDLETLEALVDEGIRFTVLAPNQAGWVKGAGQDWQDVRGGKVNPRRAYTQRLPSGRTIALFFYDGPISQAVAFEQLLTQGERLAGRLIGAFTQADEDQLVHIATDGETYGHHHRYGEMALSYALQLVEERSWATLTNYAQFLELCPPAHEVRIEERTSWSCAHGVERWRADCGCNSGGNPGWHQRWRAPLRRALDWLRDTASPIWERRVGSLVRDPWAARDAYIDVILDATRIDAFLATHQRQPLSARDQTQVLELMELQRHALLMYTSCGWFFDEISGIETVQILQYAARVIQLARRWLGVELETDFMRLLEEAPSNVAELINGSHIYAAQVQPKRIELRQVGEHYAIQALFTPPAERTHLFCYEIREQDRASYEAGAVVLAMGQIEVEAVATRDMEAFSYVILHLGDHNILGGIMPRGALDLAKLEEEATGYFQRAELPALIRLLDHTFSGETFTLRSLFRDEQRRVMERIMRVALRDAEASYRQSYQHRASLMYFLADLGSPLPRSLRAAAEIVVNNQLERHLCAQAPDVERTSALVDEALARNIPLDGTTLGYTLHQTLVRLARAWLAAPEDVATLERLAGLTRLARGLPFDVSIWEVQNACWQIRQRAFHVKHAEDAAWQAAFVALCEAAKIAPV
jgi:alpha-amylase/alpha-mannosidase (GH57 family)